MPKRLSIDIPDDGHGLIEIDVRRAGETVATLALQLEPLAATSPTEPAKTNLAGEERERQILDVAGEVISEKGFAATSIRDIASATGLSIAALYRHIGSKDELLYRITQTRMQELFDHFEANLTDGGTASARLSEAIAVYLAYITKNHRYINLVYRETKALDDRARAKIYDTERRFMKLWEQIISDGVAAGEFAEVDTWLTANLAYFSCTVWALRHWSIGDRTEADVGNHLTKLILGGLQSD